MIYSKFQNMLCSRFLSARSGIVRIQSLLLVMLVCAGANAADRLVPAQYATIQDAIDASSDGDVILVSAGTYAPISIIGKDLTIRGVDGAAATTIDGGGSSVLINQSGNSFVTYEQLTLANGSGTSGVYNSGIGVDDFSFVDCAFVNNTGTIAGVLSLPVRESSMIRCTFVGNSGNDAGAIRVLAQSSSVDGLDIIDCIFDSNTSSEGAGALLYFASTINVTHRVIGSTFTNNSGVTSGAITHSFEGTVLDDCVFSMNSATSGAGAINAIDGLTITNSTITDNHTDSNGGGAFIGGSSSISGSSITLNTAQGNGGGIVMGMGGLVANCTIEDNDATSDGGGLWTDQTIDIQNTNFTSNSAGGSGGGAWIGGNGATLTDCDFALNWANGSGGGLHAAEMTAVLERCDMNENTAGTTGGGLYIESPGLAVYSDSSLCMNTPDEFNYTGSLLATNLSGCGVSSDPVGAVCLPNGNCAVLTEAQALAVGGVYQGDGTACETAVCAEACIADLNNDGVLDVFDVFDYLSLFNAGCP
jgi:hypothetical protein